MPGLADLPYEILLGLLLRSGNENLVSVCQWTYFCLGREATPRQCYKFVRTKGGWNKGRVISTALQHRFLNVDLLDQIDRNQHELIVSRRKSKRWGKGGECELAGVRIPGRLFKVDEDWAMPEMRKLRNSNRNVQKSGAKKKRRRRAINPNQQRFDIVRRLLSMGVSVQGGRCAVGLVLSAKAGNLSMIRLLLKNGADAEGGGDNKALLLAIVYGHLDVAKRLVKSGAPINSLALRYAVQKRHTSVVEWLLKKGATPDMITIKLLDDQ
ncbi:hypothetical protein COEREDRAFT_82412 [Coemansia reversa NRRL 1564]|uniref:Uncharacterized protein n=1 Tax=Coemansia reversa (strain ATCC 12441 / NRRL 1564) TaxID=763665 RepID=A0A2G5B7K5_COERN|nr:hypothetical protein COEREDRAFT_82412 [Coemansia reversa NRRL 1564]|eukprot:PIA14998.1 hypothetical protein COEREDRAFT_82412 [Coemansia reversa NRRL 1564]